MKNNTPQYLHILFLGIFLFFLQPVAVFAAEVEITPAVFDFKARERDAFSETITLTNTSGRRIDVYVSVNNIDTIEGEKEFEIGRAHV